MDEEAVKRIINREREAREEAEYLLEQKSNELHTLNQNLEKLVNERTEKLSLALQNAQAAMKTKDDFVSNMSHEIRTPLNAIMGFVEVLRTSEYEKESFTKYLNIIHDSSEHLLKIINDILDFSKLQSGQFKISMIEVDLQEKLQHTYSLFSKLADGKRIDFDLVFANDFPKSFMVDDVRVIQVVSNFLSNALKFTPVSGSVKMDIDYDHLSCELIVKIIDTGIGIKQEAQENIFNSFEQEDKTVTREYGGTGLGLAISKKLIELMSGELLFESTQGKGSLFGFKIPLEVVEEKANEMNESDSLGHSFSGQALVVEDNEVNVLLISILLEEYQISFDVVGNGLLAIEAVQNNDYALVFMDNQMPKLSGRDATIEIRKFNQEVPIVALSANALKTEKEAFLKIGMNDVLTKPIDKVELLEVLEKYM
jgi:signal transduction histidine kinase/CheY-like chemotaxis protein